MTDTTTETRSVVMERELAHAPEKVWRALTEPHLIGEWLMPTDFEPRVGRPFQLVGDWGAVACEVREVEPNRRLVYSWAAHGLESLVTWTLAPSGTGTVLRMEQSGFAAGQDQFYQGAQAGWPRFLAALDKVLAGLD
jgi:uncharacterized protein YndB with AHSA1/START domain